MIKANEDRAHVALCLTPGGESDGVSGLDRMLKEWVQNCPVACRPAARRSPEPRVA